MLQHLFMKYNLLLATIVLLSSSAIGQLENEISQEQIKLVFEQTKNYSLNVTSSAAQTHTLMNRSHSSQNLYKKCHCPKRSFEYQDSPDPNKYPK